jgi:hypothetical protein
MSSLQSIQERNLEMANLLRPEFVGRNEIAYSGKSLLSSLQLWTALRGLWYFGGADDALDVPDQSGQGRTLFFVSGALRTITDANFVGSSNNNAVGRFTRLDEPGLSISGTETGVGTAFRGMTIGGWFHPTATAGGILAKWNTTGANRSYLLQTFNGTFRIAISNAGAAVEALATSAAYTTTGYYFLCAVFNPSTYLRLYVGDNEGNFTYTEDAVAVPASIRVGTSDFEAYSYDGANINDGQLSTGWLCAALHSESFVQMIYHMTLFSYAE